MTNVVDLRNAFAANVISPSTTGLTASGDSAGVDTLAADGPFVFDINVGTVGGTSTPTAVFKVQESSDNSTFTDVVAPNAGPALTVTVTTTGSYQIFCAVAVKRYLRLDYAITGTSPVFPTSARVFANNKISGTGGGFSTSPQT